MPLGETITTTAEDGTETSVYLCSECETEHEYEYEAHDCCTYWCDNCGTTYTSEHMRDECCQYECDNCGGHWQSPEEAERCCEQERIRAALFNPEYPSTIDQTDISHVIVLGDGAGQRAQRYTSIEQELTAGATAAAHMLYNIGTSEYSDVLNYSQDSQVGRAIVKHDGSLPDGGGEVVYSRFNLTTSHDADRFSKAIACMREMESHNIVEVGSQAGVHVHVSALDMNRQNVFGPAQMAALWEIFSFGEDVIYRLGAAGHESHRGTEYTRILPKLNRPDLGGNVSAGKITKAIQGNRYYSINFRRLLDAASRCSCGACMVGDWEECECGTLERGTIEWRVFNSTTDPLILHAWIVLAHGLTEAAFTHTLGSLQPHEYGTISPELHPWIFGWLLWNCPFEDGERQLLLDTARQSPELHLPWSNIDTFHERWELIQPELAEPVAPAQPEGPFTTIYADNWPPPGFQQWMTNPTVASPTPPPYTWEVVEDAHDDDAPLDDAGECTCDECVQWRLDNPPQPF